MDQEKDKTDQKTFHEKNKPFTCNICKAGFRLNRWLENHMSKVHSEKKKFNCDLCDICFILKSSLNEHVERVHQEKTCEI